jgi:hypothetical protein
MAGLLHGWRHRVPFLDVELESNVDDRRQALRRIEYEREL